MTVHPTRLELLKVDVDCRIPELWMLAADVLPADQLEQIGELLRAAYAKGYEDAATGDRSLYQDNGYRVPR